ncbi:hypothetical protein IQ288_13390 [Burkholderia sp. R-69980]|nr:hypothetical protein [Burkholderia sp. R-69980]
MSLSKDYEVPSTGASASYHVINQVTADYEAHNTIAVIASYVSKSARESGKYPLYTQTIMFEGEPPDGQNLRAYAQEQLAGDAPTDGDVSPFPNRYAFSGASIVD